MSGVWTQGMENYLFLGQTSTFLVTHLPGCQASVKAGPSGAPVQLLKEETAPLALGFITSYKGAFRA